MKPSTVLRLLTFLRRENLHRILLVLVALSFLGAVALWWLEPSAAFADWLWWSIVTLTTVGYGDITPTTLGGRFVGIALMFFGIGVLSTFTATLAGFLVERKLMKDRGMVDPDLRGHLILCRWNERAREILRELRAGEQSAQLPVVLIDDLEQTPMDDPHLYFVRGTVDDDTLRRAGLERASTVIILGDDRRQPSTRDAQVVLATLTVESINPDVYTIVELAREENVRHCQRAHADEIIVADQLSSRLIASAAADHGLSKVLSELLSNRFGSELQQRSLPEDLAGRPFVDALSEVKRRHDLTVLALARGGEVLTNPSAELPLEAGDRLIVIAPEPARRA